MSSVGFEFLCCDLGQVTSLSFGLLTYKMGPFRAFSKGRCREDG